MIKVTVQEVNRLEAINNLSRAICDLARALSVAPHIDITDCTLTGIGDNSYGIMIDTDPDVTETIIMHTENGNQDV